MVRYPIASLALLAALSAPSAFAGYAQATPPSGWSSGSASSGSGGAFNATAANAATLSNGTVRTNASMNVGGRAVSLPATMRFAANAPRVAASFIMLNPYVRTAATVAGWLGLAGLVYDATSGLWTTNDPAQNESELSDGFSYRIQGITGYYPSKNQACTAALTAFPGSASVTSSSPECYITYTRDGIPNQWFRTSYDRLANPSCPSGWYVTPAGCVQTVPPKTVTPERAVEDLIKHPMPEHLPNILPIPLPVETPAIEPVFIPMGDPVRNPSFDPGQAPSPSNPPAVQPGTEVKPAPAPGSPWQVDIRPVNRPVTDPTAVPDREPVPLPNPGGPGSGEPPTENPPREDANFCELNPNILACLDVGEADTPPDLPTKEIDFNFQIEGGFAGNRTCPAPKEIGPVVLDYSGLCTALDIARNVLLAMAWVSAALIVLRGGVK